MEIKADLMGQLIVSLKKKESVCWCNGQKVVSLPQFAQRAELHCIDDVQAALGDVTADVLHVPRRINHLKRTQSVTRRHHRRRLECEGGTGRFCSLEEFRADQRYKYTLYLHLSHTALLQVCWDFRTVCNPTILSI